MRGMDSVSPEFLFLDSFQCVFEQSLSLILQLLHCIYRLSQIKAKNNKKYKLENAATFLCCPLGEFPNLLIKEESFINSEICLKNGKKNCLSQSGYKLES
jgi:hypothetical protein